MEIAKEQYYDLEMSIVQMAGDNCLNRPLIGIIGIRRREFRNTLGGMRHLPIQKCMSIGKAYKAKSVIDFYNGRGTAEGWIKEGKYALNWARLSCHEFVANCVRLQLFILAYNLGNFLRRLALPRAIKHWSLRSLKEKLIKIGAKVVSHSRYLIFQMSEVAVSGELFSQMLERIERLRAVSAELRC